MTAKDDLKLYVWEDVLQDYACGIMFALAHDENEARELILDDPNEDRLNRTMCNIKAALKEPTPKNLRRVGHGMQRDLLTAPRCITSSEGFHINGSA